MTVRTRFSPSPTGMIHLGNGRTALFCALFAKQQHGDFVLRIEDTDQTRSEEQYTEAIQDDLHWLGVDWQEGPDHQGPYGPYLQSERASIYAKHYQSLEEKQLIYPCFCTDQELLLARKMQLSKGIAPRYAGNCRQLSKEDVQEKIKSGLKPAWRFIVPKDQKVVFTDLVKGEQVFYTNDIGDFIIRRQDGTASFLFCNAIDDAEMKITHVFRGEDHLTNTSRQILILQALRLSAPHYGHLSLIVGEGGSPLSKREGGFSLRQMQEEGYLALAIINYLSRLGHTLMQQDLLSFDALAAAFQADKLSRSPSRFDESQLLHWQKLAVSSLNEVALRAWLGDALMSRIEVVKQALFIETIKDNILLPRDAVRWEAALFHPLPPFAAEKIQILRDAGEPFMLEAIHAVEEHGIHFQAILTSIQQTLGVNGKKLYMPLRLALTGEMHGPALHHVAELLGQETMKDRLKAALQYATHS